MKYRLALLGWPAGHSLSPAMHEAALDSCGLEGTYQAFSVPPERLGDALRGLVALGFHGCNVTIPHKTDVVNLSDRISDSVSAMGAANTLSFVKYEVHAENTDAPGFLEAFQHDLKVRVNGQSFLVLGAGGAARGTVWALLHAGASQVYITNRTAERAEQLVADLKHVNLQAVDWDARFEVLAECLGVINTTSAGMTPHARETPMPGLVGPYPDKVAYDLVYRPRPSRFLQDARAAGMATADGLGMLVAQAALSFAIWTGQEPSRWVMREAAEHQLML